MQFKRCSFISVTIILAIVVKDWGLQTVAVRWRVRRKHGPRIRMFPLKGKSVEIQLTA